MPLYTVKISITDAFEYAPVPLKIKLLLFEAREIRKMFL